MLFFALVGVVALVAWVLGWLGVPWFDGVPVAMRWGLALPLILIGIDHLRNPGRYLPMIPSVVPRPAFIVAFTGYCEIAGGAGLLVPRTQWLAGLMLAIYFVAVFPANIKVVQPVIVWWALYSAQITSWPVG